MCKKGKNNEAKELTRKALHNVKVVYNKDYYSINDIDINDVEEFINERFKGIHITEPNLNSIYKLLKQ